MDSLEVRRRLAAGLCSLVSCGKERPLNCTRYCAEHRKKAYEGTVETRTSRVLRGECAECGAKRGESKSLRLCEPHRIRRDEAIAKFKERP